MKPEQIRYSVFGPSNSSNSNNQQEPGDRIADQDKILQRNWAALHQYYDESEALLLRQVDHMISLSQRAWYVVSQTAKGDGRRDTAGMESDGLSPTRR